MRFQIGTGPLLHAASSLTQGSKFGEFRVELPVDIGLPEEVSLDLAARGLGNAFGRNDLRDFEARMLIDEPADGGGGGQKLLHGAAVQYEHAQFLTLGVDAGDVRGYYFVEVQAGCMLCDVLEIVGVVILTIDENDLLAPARDVQRSFVEYSKVTRIHPTILTNSLRGGFQIAEITVCDAGAAYQYVAYDTLWQRGGRILHEAQLRIGNPRSDAHEFDDITRIRGIELDARATS